MFVVWTVQQCRSFCYHHHKVFRKAKNSFGAMMFLVLKACLYMRVDTAMRESLVFVKDPSEKRIMALKICILTTHYSYCSVCTEPLYLTTKGVNSAVTG